MINKIFICSTLFLLLPLTTQCMKRYHGEMINYEPSTALETSSIIKPTIKELQLKYDNFKKKLNFYYDPVTLHLDFTLVELATPLPHSLLLCTYKQVLHKRTCLEVLYKDRTCFADIPAQNFFLHFNIDKLKKGLPEHINTLKNARWGNDYSALGSATMAEEVTFQEKQEFIHILLKLGLEPTSDDRELALVERWKRWQPIIHKIYLLRYAQFFIEIPCGDVTKFIEFLMLETEKSLF